MCIRDSNYTNPMAMNCWAWYEGSPHQNIVGLCHSIQNTSRQVAEYVGVPPEEITFHGAGVNHMSWVLRVEHDGRSLYPALDAAIAADPEGLGRHVRVQVYKRFGYFPTESSEHFAEYVPWFMRDEAEIERLRIPVGEYVRRSQENLEMYAEEKRMLAAGEPFEIERSGEYAALIIHSMVTGLPRTVYGNVRNTGLITNLPRNACVEVPCLVDRAGLQRGLQPGPVHQARHFDAGVPRQVRDEAGVAHVAVHGARKPRHHGVDDERRVLPAALDLEGLAGGQHALLLGVHLEVLLAAPDVLAHGDAQALYLGLVAHEPGHVLGEVLARLGREVAEALVDLHADVAAEPFGVGRDRRVERRVEAPAVVLHAQHPAHVVHAGAVEGDLLRRHADVLGHLTAGVLDGVAEADDILVRRALVPGPAVHRHRVGVVEHPGAGAQLGHVVGDAEHDRDGAQGAEHGAHPRGVGDRLAQAVLLRDLEVEQRRRVAADLDHIDGEVGAVEGAAAKTTATPTSRTCWCTTR